MWNVELDVAHSCVLDSSVRNGSRELRYKET